MKEYFRKNRFNILLMAIYIVLSFIIMLSHEAWRDEAQAWLIARDLNVIDIIKQMKYEGHPVLWYFILVPFAKIGLPYLTIEIISWLITCLSAYLIITKSPFNKLFKVLLVFSMPLLYLYPAIARSYCIIPLAISLIAINYETRKEKPIRYVLSIALLANTHVIMLGLVGMLLLVFYLEQIKNRKENTKLQNRNILLSFFVIVLLLILTAIPIASSIKTNTDINHNFEITNRTGKVLLQQIEINIHYLFGSHFDVIIIAALILLLLYEIRYYPKYAIMICLSIGFPLCIYTFIYSCSLQRAGAMLLIGVLFAWIQSSQKKETKVEDKVAAALAFFLLIVNICYGAKQIKTEFNQNYSNAEQTANYIQENIPEGKFICPNIAYSSSLIPYLNQKYLFWNPQAEQYFTYVTWDENYEQKYNLDEFKEKLNRNFTQDEKLYLINNNWDEELLQALQEQGKITKLFEAKNSIRGEDYEIYAINKKARKEI